MGDLTARLRERRTSVVEPVARDGGWTRVVLPDGGWAWLVSGYEEARFVLTDPRFSSDITLPGFPGTRRASSRAVPKGAFMAMDRPEHTRYRSLVAREFSARRVAAFESTVDRIVSDRTAALTGPPADLVPALTHPVPVEVMNEILGVPAERGARLEELGAVLLSHEADDSEIRRANRVVAEDVLRLCRQSVDGDRDDVVTRLARAAPGAGLTLEELATVVVVLFTAGTETTAGTLAAGLAALLARPELWRALVDDPEELCSPVAEELLRHQTVLHGGLPRVATEDVARGGLVVRAGDGVVVMVDAANRDPSVFRDPDALDPFGRSTRGHLAFGHGVHLCVGHRLAALELRSVLRHLAARLPNLALAADPATLPFVDSTAVVQLTRLPVTW